MVICNIVTPYRYILGEMNLSFFKFSNLKLNDNRDRFFS
jgi:hypothetical protein